jgi:hypothetical protein
MATSFRAVVAQMGIMDALRQAHDLMHEIAEQDPEFCVDSNAANRGLDFFLQGGYPVGKEPGPKLQPGQCKICFAPEGKKHGLIWNREEKKNIPCPNSVE